VGLYNTHPVLTYITAEKASLPPEDFFHLSAEELLRRSAINAEKLQVTPCLRSIRVEISFAGTNNNMARYRDGQAFTAGEKIVPPKDPAQVSLPEVKCMWR
jgi:hypothetical protein